MLHEVGRGHGVTHHCVRIHLQVRGASRSSAFIVVFWTPEFSIVGWRHDFITVILFLLPVLLIIFWIPGTHCVCVRVCVHVTQLELHIPILNCPPN